MKYYLLALILTIFCKIGFSQTSCYTQKNGVVTDPNIGQAVNPQCTSRVNIFDWRKQFWWQPFPNDPTAPVVRSAFWFPNNPTLEYLHDIVSNGSVDYEPEDGWELLQHSLDWNSSQKYVLLYNRYTSIIRLLTIPPPALGQKILVTLKVDSKQQSSGLLNPNGSKMLALDQKSVGIASIQLPKYGNTDSYIMADFPVEYDACTCSLNGGLYNIEYKTINASNVELYGRFTQTTSSLSNCISNPGTCNLDPRYMQSLYTEQSRFRNIAGVSTFRNYQSMLSYHSELAAKKGELERDYAFFEGFSDVMSVVGGFAGPLLGGATIPIPITLRRDFTATQARILRERNARPSPDPDSSKIVKFDLSGKNILDIVVGIVDFAGAGLKSRIDGLNNRINTLTDGVTFSQGEISMSGEITSDNLTDGPSFNIPGMNLNNTTGCNSPIGGLTYPVYNEALGRFALLKTPTYVSDISWSAPDISNPSMANVYNNLGFNLGSKIEYRFNPAAEVNETETEIMAALRVIIRYPITNNVTRTNMNLIRTDTVFKKTILGGVTTVTTVPDSVIAVYQTPLVPLGCAETLGADVSVFDYNPSGTIKSVVLSRSLVLFIKYVFNKRANQQEAKKAFQIYTYDCIDAGLNNSQRLTFISNKLPKYEYRLNVRNIHYTSDATFFAWDYINISGNITAAPGVNVRFIAPRINVDPSASIGDGIALEVGVLPFTCNSTSQYNSSLLSNYCTQGIYQADVATKNGETQDSIRVQTVVTTLAKLPFTAAPNPFNEGGVRIDFGLEQAGRCIVTVHDVLGKQVAVLMCTDTAAEGPQQLYWDAAGAPVGIYFVTLHTEQGRQSIKVSKQ